MQVRKILTCPICLVEFCEPVSICCGHTVCKACLTSFVDQSPFPSCPLCRNPTFAPIGNQWELDDILVEILNIQKTKGEKGLLDEFSNLIICFDCGLTPIKPVLLSCNHLFCHDCIQRFLQIELICPVCNEWATYLPQAIPVNTVYNELIEWYTQQHSNEIEEEHHQQKQQDNISNNLKVCGIPIFFFDQLVHLKQKLELTIIEQRYIQLLKIVGNGSGHFPIVTQIKQLENLPLYADLVQIIKIKQINDNRIQVKIQGTHRIIVTEIYTMSQIGEKIPFTNKMHNDLPGQLWMCNFESVNDSFKIDFDSIQFNWFKIQSILRTSYLDMSPRIKEIFQYPLSLVCMEDKSKQREIYLEQKNIQDASLILIKMLKIRASDYCKLYYDDMVLCRLQFIWEHFQRIQSQLVELLGEGMDSKTIIKPANKIILQSKINYPLTDEIDEDDDDSDIKIIQFKELTLTQQIFMNLFKIENILQIYE